MGLDIYMYEVKKVDFFNPSKIYEMEDFDNKIFALQQSGHIIDIFSKEEIRERNNCAIVNNSIEVKVNMEYIDAKAIAKIMGVKRINSSKIEELSKDNYKIHINKKEKIFTLKELAPFKIKKIEKKYLCEIKEVAYQRGIEDLGWHYLSSLGNCVDSTSCSFIKEMFLQGLLSEDFIKNWNENCYFVAWW